MKKNLLIPVLLFFTACSTKEQETIGHITQRRLDGAGKLVISYQFNTGEKWVSDSMEVTNRIIPHDSIKVVYSVEHPQKSRLLLP